MTEELKKKVKVINEMLNQRDYIAWVCWDGNLEYLCTDEKKLMEHDPSFVSAWLSATVLRTSYERTRIRLLGRR